MKIEHPHPSWGVSIIEDTETGELSFQCICGGIAMYYRRIVLTKDEAAQWRAGTLDADQLVSDVCKEAARVADRMVPSIPQDELD